MTPPTWPAALVLVALILATTVLGVRGVIPAVWIEHTLTALVGLILGALGGRVLGHSEVSDSVRRARSEGKPPGAG